MYFTGSLQGDMGRVQINIRQQTSDSSDIETRLLNLESTQAKRDIELQARICTVFVLKSVLQNMSAVLDGVNMDPTSHFVTFEDFNDTISDTEANFESENEINKELITNIAQSETDMTSHISTIQTDTDNSTQVKQDHGWNFNTTTNGKSQGEIILALNDTVMQLEKKNH